MIGGLSQKQEPIAACLANLAEGYRAELQGQVKEALDFYQKVIDGGHTALVEDALVRIVVLAKDGQDYGMLKLALECLTGLSPIYSPQYADLLWLLGEQHAALDVYADYLEKIPGDFRALLQLSRYYLALGSPEAARTALQLVLDQDPGNQTAQCELAKLNPAS
jgi:tetratricopeptide (TPR) repeat protein